MSDNNEYRVNQESILLHENEESYVLLKDLAIEFEEELYSVKVQIKNQNELLVKKQKELLENERTRVHNLDLFSPIYDKAYDNRELSNAIDEINKNINELKDKEEKLVRRVNGLKTAAAFIDRTVIEEINSDKSNEVRHKFNDQGLSILEAQENERQRIARELHDTTVQNLTSIVHKLELSNKLIDIDSIRAKLELTAMTSTVKTTINDMRGIIYNLKPMSLDDLGFTITLDRYAHRIRELHNINVDVHSNKETNEILPVIKLTIFRIIQEACNNVIKHANATLININIFYEEHQITVKIEDNGDGFNLDHNRIELSGQSSSFGLSIMRERISLLSGTIEIQSEEKKGTVVTITAPLTIYEGDKNE